MKKIFATAILVVALTASYSFACKDMMEEQKGEMGCCMKKGGMMGEGMHMMHSKDHGTMTQDMMTMMMDMMKMQKKMMMKETKPAQKKEMMAEIDKMMDKMDKMMTEMKDTMTHNCMETSEAVPQKGEHQETPASKGDQHKH